eukprot:6190139-Pleurochrysis_carterae.AAC.2
MQSTSHCEQGSLKRIALSSPRTVLKLQSHCKQLCEHQYYNQTRKKGMICCKCGLKRASAIQKSLKRETKNSAALKSRTGLSKYTKGCARGAKRR